MSDDDHSLTIFQVGDWVRTVDYCPDGDEEGPWYGPPTVIQAVRLNGRFERPEYVCRNPANGRICHRMAFEIERVPADLIPS